MARIVRVGAAQLGPVPREHTREQVVERLLALLGQAGEAGCELVVYPELALTTFFPRWFVDDIAEADHWYERSMPNAATQPLFDEAERLGIGFCLGYALLEEVAVEGAQAGERQSAAEAASSAGVGERLCREPEPNRNRRWNVQTLVERDGSIVATFKKVHIPGHAEHEPDRPFQHAERYYFEPSPDGFGVWDAFGGRVGMMICNDRRWPESYREMGLQGVELILCGYNTPLHYAPDPSQDPLQGFHNSLVMQAGAYQNGTFVVGVAKGGIEEGVPSLCDSRIIAPSGEVLAAATTDADELIVADCDLDWCKQYTGTLFDFDRYRRPEVYTHLTARRGVRIAR